MLEAADTPSPEASPSEVPVVLEAPQAPDVPEADTDAPAGLADVVEPTPPAPPRIAPTVRERIQLSEATLKLRLFPSWREELTRSGSIIGLSRDGVTAVGDVLLQPSLQALVETVTAEHREGMFFVMDTGSWAALVRARAAGLLGAPLSSAQVFVIVPRAVWAAVEPAAIDEARRDGIPLGAGTVITFEIVRGRLRVVDIRRT
jgi:hypothetical protein